MTRAKSKPTTQTRDTARRAPATPTKSAALVVHADKPKPSKAEKPVVAKAAPAKAAKPVAAKPVAAKAAPAKAAPAKAAPAKATPSAVKPAKAAPTKVTAAAVKAAVLARAASPTATKAAAAKAAAAAAKAAPQPSPTAARFDTAAKLRPIEQAVGVNSDAVARRTGKSWPQWFALLDAAGAGDLDHKGIVAVLAQRHGVGPWWQQMITVAYEHARGKSAKEATEDGFQVDLVKVLELPLAKLYRLWSEPSERNKWLADDRFSIHKASASKSIHARWGRGVSRIDVDFSEKGPAKSQVTVLHHRIETSEAAEQMKTYWAKKIRALEALLD
jgi:hypothetical protein